MNIITGYRGEPHITAQEDRDLNLGVVGNSLNDVYVLDVGQKLEADIVTANEIRIRDGIMVMQGCAASIDYGAYDSLEISNGALGMQRIDIIAAQYEKDADTSVENVSLVVVEGTPDAADPQPPALTGGDLQGGDTFIQMPLYYVNLDGVSIDSIEQQFIVATNLAESTIAPDVLAKWDDITGTTAHLNNIIDKIADDWGGANVMWSGANYMAANISLTGLISEQHKGIVLCWSAYENGQAKDYDFVYHFVPKEHVANFSGFGVNFFLNTLARAGHKYLYILDDRINGYSTNDAASQTGTVSQIRYSNSYWVLRMVLGV